MLPKVMYCCVCDKYINGEAVIEFRGSVELLFHPPCHKDFKQKQEPKFGEVLDIDGTLD